MLKLLLAIVTIYAVFVAFIYVTQHRMLYFPNLPGRALIGSPLNVGLAYEDVAIETADNVRLHGWWVPGHSQYALLFFHGNAGNISHRLDSIKLFHDLGLSVLIIDYRGYGASEGRTREAGTYEDAEAAWAYLTETRSLAAENIVIFGRSLGGAIAAWLAARRSPAGLIVESAFTSVPELAQALYPFLPARWLSRFKYATREYIASVAAPVLIVHSRDDEIAPFRHGEAIFEAANEPRAFLELNGSHNDAHASNVADYAAGLSAFLSQQVGAGMRAISDQTSQE